MVLTHLADHDEKFEIIFSTNLLNISFYFTLLYPKPRNLSDYDHDIHQHHVPTVKSLEIETEITVLNKKIRKLDSKRIIRIRIINEIIEGKKIRYI